MEQPANYNHLPKKQLESLYLYPTTAKVTEHELGNLISSKSTDPYSIPPKILKLMKGIISKPPEII